ncbi:regulator of G-protein signaling 3-like isoform X2 [Solea senegalensis]|uniref:Regulator of G-protein signaling 3-like isoform X2 n=1 Tax=Solea senegalensis TaxID=28829 RepID=A0AAV6QFR4_SOLSE|nr:regulator of G-protein signaling 3-like isoform X2 [Solea senegalensis]
MEAVSLCSRKRSSGGFPIQLHQEAQFQPAACKRRCTEEQEMKRRRPGEDWKENRDLEDMQRNWRRENRRFSQTGPIHGKNVRTGLSENQDRSGFRSGSEILSNRPEVREALIRKARIKTSVQTVVFRSSELVQGLIITDQMESGFTETWQDQKRPTQLQQTRTTVSRAEVRSRSSAGTQKTAGLAIDRSSENRTSRRIINPEPMTGKGGGARTMSSFEGRRPEPGTRRRRKIHPSVFRGRGRLRLSITPEVGQLFIHIHEARGLMGKCQKPCDSYVKVTVTSDLDHNIRMKTQTVLDNRNPQYDQNFTLCVGDDVYRGRLLVSVFRKRSDSRCRQLIGCMSFGISSLILSSEPVTGWFYLLGEEFGLSKHLRVTSQRSRPMRKPGEDVEKVPTLCADLRRTPDSPPDSDLNRVTTTATVAATGLSNCTASTTGLKNLTNRSGTYSLDPSNSIYSSAPTKTDNSSYVSVRYNNANQHLANQDNSSHQLMVNIIRGTDGFGFTICSDCPVKVQAVDPGGPAYQSGLRQGDSVLQLNGLPVETWKCVELAHAIRSCPSQIVLVVWRGLPDLRSGCEALLHPTTNNTITGRKLLPHPTLSKHGRRRGQGSVVRSSLAALGSLWRDRKEEQDEQEEGEEEDEDEAREIAEYSRRTTTLKGTRVTSSNGDNYIILSPVSSGGQQLHPIYQDRNGTIGRLYQTHPSRGQNLLRDPRPGSSRQSFTSHTSTLPPPLSSSSSASMPSNYGNYQNCTIVQSHLPCSAYESLSISVAPKTVIFPIFVQPLDLCSPERTLLMSEEMILHQADLLPAKVTVLIYNDVLLLTREDEAGRCNVLQSPLFLNTLHLREVSSQSLHIYIVQTSQTCCRCIFSLESFSIEQKIRVRLCLHDNIHHQLISTESAHSHQHSDLPSDFGLLSLGQSDLLYRPSSPDPPLLHPYSCYSSPRNDLRPPSPSPYAPNSPCSSSTPPPPPPFSSLSPYTTSSSSLHPRNITALSHLPPPPSSSSSFPLRSPVWKEKGRADEEERRKRRKQEEEDEVEERQQGEGESASETSENVGVVWGRRHQFSPQHFNMKEEEESDEYEEEEGGSAKEFPTSYRPVLQRSLSEGSLLQEPRSPRFLSDSTIHRLTRTMTFDADLRPCPKPLPPSPHTLRKQLTKEGGSLHHMLLLLNGTKVETIVESIMDQDRQVQTSRAQDRRLG